MTNLRKGSPSYFPDGTGSELVGTETQSSFHCMDKETGAQE